MGPDSTGPEAGLDPAGTTLRNAFREHRGPVGRGQRKAGYLGWDWDEHIRKAMFTSGGQSTLALLLVSTPWITS